MSGPRSALAQGFSAPDLTVLRFGVAGLIMLPMLLRMGLRDLGRARLAAEAWPSFWQRARSSACA